ncbi:MAG: hypothetical protein JXA30_02165 [Deltaproteobacteria bacterium]|nr:hypothetical protein [Deltaproteobacteria bacterium]
MVKRAKPFWFITINLLFSTVFLLAVSCGGDDNDKDDVTGGKSGGESGKNGGESGKNGGSGTGEAGSNGSEMLDASVDGAIMGPASTGNVQEGETCSAMISSMTATTMKGECKPSGTTCPGGSAGSSDCAPGLVCCVGTDQCEALGASVSSMGFIEGLSCVPAGDCPPMNMMGMSIPIALQLGCPSGQACCPKFPEGGFQFPEGGFPFLEGGMPGGGDSSTADAGD